MSMGMGGSICTWARFTTKGPSRICSSANDGTGKFRPDEQEALRISTRASAVLFVDLDNDGDLDLYISSMPSGKGNKPAPAAGGGRYWVARSSETTAVGSSRTYRRETARARRHSGTQRDRADYDGDGLLDLLVGEDPHPGYNGSTTKVRGSFAILAG